METRTGGSHIALRTICRAAVIFFGSFLMDVTDSVGLFLDKWVDLRAVLLAFILGIAYHQDGYRLGVVRETLPFGQVD